MSNNVDDLQELARNLLRPARHPQRPPADVWERFDSVPTRYGPVATWSAGSGPAVLLVHGWEGNHADMEAFVTPIVRASRRAVAFDLPAHGESAGEFASLWDLATALEDVAAWCDGADAIVAHSAGCAAASIALGRGLEARKVAFVAPPLRYEHFIRFAAQRQGLDGDRLVAAFDTLGYEIDRLDIRTNAASIDVPLLIVHSRDDRICAAENATKICDAWKNSTVEFVEGLGHTRILRDPAVVERIATYIVA